MSVKYLVGASVAALLAFSTAGYAADVVGNEPPAPEASIPLFSWTGAYIGLNAGYAGGSADHSFSLDAGAPPVPVLGGSLDFNSSGFIGGAQVGYNYQMDQFVLGVEADFQGSGVKGEGSLSIDDGAGNTLDARLGTKLDWYGTVRARLGAAVTDRFMVYATGGLAYGRTKSYIDANVNGVPALEASVSKTKVGWTVGAGAEYAVTEHVSFKTEYLYTDLGKANLYSGDLGFGPGVDASLDRKFNFHTVRVGVNYKF